MKLTYDRILDNPDLLSRAVAEAKRERALAMNRLVFAPLAALLRQGLRMPGCSSQGSSKASASSSPAGALG